MTLPAAPKLPNWISQLKGWAKGKLLLRFRIQNGSVKLQIKFYGWPLSGWRYIRQASGVGCSQCSCKQALQLSPFRYGPVGGQRGDDQKVNGCISPETCLEGLHIHTDLDKEPGLTHGVLAPIAKTEETAQGLQNILFTCILFTDQTVCISLHMSVQKYIWTYVYMCVFICVYTSTSLPACMYMFYRHFSVFIHHCDTYCCDLPSWSRKIKQLESYWGRENGLLLKIPRRRKSLSKWTRMKRDLPE